MISTRLLTLVLLAPLSFATAQTSATDVTALLDEQLGAAQRLTVDEIFSRALNLRDIAMSLGDPTGREEGASLIKLDSAIASKLENADPLSPEAILFLNACHLQSEEPDVEASMRSLLPLLRTGSDAVSIAASELFGNNVFKRGLEPDSKIERLAALLSGAGNADWAPERRLASAYAAYRTGGGTERRQARGEMLAFLDSSNPRLRRLGALALGRIGEVVRGRLRTELKRVASLPGADGALAESYLKQEEIKTLHDRKFQNLQENFSQKTLPEHLRMIEEVFQLIKSEHLNGELVKDDELVNAAANGMLHALDQHSTYLGSEYFKRFQQELDAEYGGIGAYVDTDLQDGLFTITRPIYSGPAYKAGLTSDDKIVRIDDWPTRGENREDIIKRLKGKPGTPVRLYIWRRGMDAGLIDRPEEDMLVTVTRAQISIPPLSVDLLPGDIGLIDLTEFSRVTSSALRETMNDLLSKGMKAMVLDLRRNSGGLLTESRNVSDLFLPKGLDVVSTQGKNATSQALETRARALLPEDVPLVILTGRFTASAAEIVAGALQDHNRAVLVGKRSFGKGSVQTLIPMQGQQNDLWDDTNGNGKWDEWEKITKDWNGNGEFDFAPHVKLTIARYILPSGRSIHHELDKDRNILSEGGIAPDVDVSMPRIEGWRLEESYRIYRDRLPREYVEERWEQHQELFRKLAIYDAKDPNAYPDFEEFMAKADTVLPRDDVRQLLRRELRRRVQDERGAEFPGTAYQGDYQEDPQLQTAIRLVLEDMGLTPDDIPEYSNTFMAPETDLDDDSLVAQLPTSDSLASTRALLEQARNGGGQLSKSTLDAVLQLLDRIGDR
ncbi:MAG: carboxyl-terminal processing protease [Planctomycetota bacterium]|jgi:carboxyl-terminal processing protease